MSTEQEFLRQEAGKEHPPSKEATKYLTSLLKRFKAFRSASDLMWRWQPVLLVTFLETYLQDLLADAARLDDDLMSESDQRASYQEINSARSVKSLADLMRFRWARNFVDSGGPAHLIDRLNRMGAKSYRPETSGHLEELWGVRHVVVHRSGFATQEFALRHPRLGATTGERIQIPIAILEDYWSASYDFVFTTEFFAQKRWPGLIRAAKTESPTENQSG